MKANPILYCLVLLTLLSCKKKVCDESPEFVGDWTSEWFGDNNIAHLNIDENSDATFQMTLEGRSRKEYKGTARANDKHLKIGGTNYFDIIEYPHLIDTSLSDVGVYDHGTHQWVKANWKMVLDGMKPASLHTCKKLSYYKADYN